MNDEKLQALREEIAGIDRTLFELIERRNAYAEQIASRKRALNLPQRDFAHEKRVVNRAEALAEERGMSPRFARELILHLIRASSTVEEQATMKASTYGSGREVLVIGGAGKMGGWMLRFMVSQGFRVVSCDPGGDVLGVESHEDWENLDLARFDIIVVATPLRLTNEVLQKLAERRPRGIVMDVGSLKSPLRSGFEALQRAGVRATSLHPMFGPDTELLSGRHVIFIDLGDQEALEEARTLFSSTTATCVEMALDEHDRAIAYVLGLSHALNIAFVYALSQSGAPATELARMSSTTFDSQLEVADKVAHENPWLYYDIQALNDFGDGSLAALTDAVSRLRDTVAQRDTDAFVDMMLQGRDYLDGRIPSEDLLQRAARRAEERDE